MPIVNLTDLSIQKIKLPAEGEVTYYDKKVRGFGLRCSAGAKTFVLCVGKKRHRTTLGRYPILSLQKARERAQELLAERTLGTIRPPTIQLHKARELFIAACEAKNKPRTVYDYKRLLKHFGKLDLRPLDSIQAYEVGDIVAGLKSKPTEAVHAFTTIRAFFRFCRKRGLILRNPIEGMEVPARLKSRDRVLSYEELGAVYRAAGECGDFGKIVRLLILTGQRRSEIASLHKDFIDTKERTITLPKTLTKNKREHFFPYGKRAAQILTLPESGLLFPARGKPGKPFNGWGKAKSGLDEKLNGVQPYVLQDLRRTFSTRLAELRVMPHVIERLLNHVNGTLSPIALVYNRAKYLEEMRGAVKLWEARIASLLTDRTRRYSRANLSL